MYFDGLICENIKLNKIWMKCNLLEFDRKCEESMRLLKKGIELSWLFQ